MLMIPVLLPWIVGGALLAGGAVASVAASRRRRAALEHYCLTRGYRFEVARPGAEGSLATSFSLFGRGRHRRWGLTITGRTGGCTFTAFEYSYVTGGGNSSRRHRVTAMLWELEGVSLPRFTLVPEGVLNRLAQRFGVQDFDFAEDPQFSRSYQLQGDDEAAVRRFFTSARRVYLTAPAPQGEKPLLHHVAAEGTRLLWWRGGRLPKPDALDEFLAEGDRLRRVFVDS
jgi:hypothetical protein